MKFFRLCKSLYSGSYIKLVILFLVMTLAMQSLTIAVGMLRYNHIVSEQIETMQSVRGVYLMQFEIDGTAFDKESIQNKREQISNLPGVRQVIHTRELYVKSGNENYTVVLYNDWMEQCFRPPHIRGEWINTPDSAVVSAYGIKQNMIRREMKLEFQYGSEKIVYPIEVAGVMGRASYLPKFSRSGTLLSLQGLLQPSYGHSQRYVIVSENSELYRAYRDAFHDYRNFLVLFENEVPAETMQALSTMGLAMDFQEICQNTEKECDTTEFYVRYLMLFSSMSLLLVMGMSLNFVREKHRNLIVYTICGCSRGRKQILSCLGTLFVTILSFLLQGILVLCYYDFELHRSLEYVAIDAASIWVLAGYTLLVIGVDLTVAYTMDGRKQPIDVLRENRK